MSIIKSYKDRYDKKQVERMSIDAYLFDGCKKDKSFYATPHERILKAFGKPVEVDTSKDERLSRIFSNRKIKTYEPFKDFYGIEDVIEAIYGHFKHATQGLEESRQVLHLLGPVGTAKSSLAERLKYLIQQEPFYTVEALNKTTGKMEISPIYESPLGLFDYADQSELIEKEFNIPRRYLKYVMSPWAVKRLKEADGDISSFNVVKIWPSILSQVGVTKVEPSDDNNQDISSLVGKVSIRQIGIFDEADPDAYSWNGGLNLTTQGLLEYIEIFKGNIKTLNPLLTATQEGHYNGTQLFGAIPHQGIILSHCNSTEWKAFKNDPKNEAFLDRFNVIKVPYCIRASDEVKIYEKLIVNSELKEAPCAPGTLEMAAQFSVLTRMKKHENSSPFLKMEVYDGKNMKNKHPSVKSME
ncbi:MAG: serine protein kinase, partial [Mucilaginibacter sp.]|nr:serine protein kinase [Mucilaginibacter sp.]